MGEQGNQVGLGSAGHEQAAGETQIGGEAILQGAHAGILAIDIITDWRRCHGRAHGRAGLGDSVAAQVDDVHAKTNGWREAWMVVERAPGTTCRKSLTSAKLGA